MSEALSIPVLTIVLLCLTVSCRHSSAANARPHFPFAYVQEDCGPTDGIAMEFYFTATQGQAGKYKEPFLQIEVNKILPASAPQSYSVEAGKWDVLAERCLKPGSCEAATSGFLHLLKLSPGAGGSGDYE
ncbi:MAG TPA: hypothetical protein VKA07_07790, partial [Candidatus Sulfotelmatobacter sp.]|nr:hypothetical protein [Candidatus Sulfotelmatobacter sp.]